MTKEMIISSSAHETRVAILEDDQVAEIFIERERQRGVVGNLYKGRVSKVLPGMQSAFVDLGLERDGFLYVSDVIASTEEFDRLETEEDEPGATPAATERRLLHRSTKLEQALPPQTTTERAKAHGERSAGSGGPAAADAASRPRQGQGSRAEDRRAAQGRAGDHRPGGQGAARHQGRPPHVPRHHARPVLVFMPTVDHVGVSRKIDSRDERGRLRGIVREFREQHGFTGGVIIRTAAAGRPKEDIVSDLSYFHRVWTDIRQKSESSRAPAVVYQEQSLVAKLLRDLLSEEYSAIPHRQRARVSPRVRARRSHHAGAFHPREALRQGVPHPRGVRRQAEIDRALRSKVWLKSGGSIVINQTEALVAIDVNTGRYVGKKSAGVWRTRFSRPISRP